MIPTIVRALRTGARVPNPTPLKWAGVAVAVGLIALNLAQGRGWLIGIQETDWIDLILALLVIYAQIASTDKIGLLPAPKAPPPRAFPAPGDFTGPYDAFFDPDDRAEVRSAEFRQSDLERLQRQEAAHAATQPLDPLALTERIRAGDFAAPERLLPQPADQPRMSFQSKPFHDARGNFTPE